MILSAEEQKYLAVEAEHALRWAAEGEFSARVTPRHAQALLIQRERDKATIQTQDAAIARLKEGKALVLDDYEIANLRAGLETLRGAGLDTGDWLGQIIMALPQVEREPNVSVTAQLDRIGRIGRS